MKRAILILVSALLLAVLCACGSGKSEPAELSFKNGLGVAVVGFYCSPEAEEMWNEPINLAQMASGHSIRFHFYQAGGENAGPGVYDLGAADENGMNYDAYGVPLAVGDEIELSGGAGRASYTVTHADGSKNSYAAEIYPSE